LYCALVAGTPADCADILRRLCSSIAICAAEFQQHDLPLHCLINNIGVESPEDDEAEHGFDVSLLLQMSCCLLMLLHDTKNHCPCVAGYTSHQLPWCILHDSPALATAKSDKKFSHSESDISG